MVTNLTFITSDAAKIKRITELTKKKLNFL